MFMLCFLSEFLHSCQSVVPLIETRTEKYFYCKAANRFSWSILSETFDDQKQKGERLNFIALQSSMVNVTW